MEIDKNSLIEATDDNRQLILMNDNCDKYDYMAAIGCGAIGAL